MCEYSCRGEKRGPVQPRYHKISAYMFSTMWAYNTLSDDGLNFTISSANVESLEDLNKRYADALLPLTITFGVFTLFGFLGNLLILIVFSLSREYRRNNFKVFVLTLAVIDLITCMTLMPAEMVKQRNFFEFENALQCKFKCFFNVFGASSSCLALLVISVDRFRKVVQPFKKQLTPKLAVKVLIGVAIVFPICLAIPGTVMCGINTTTMVNKYGTNTTIHLCETEERFEASVWRNIYKWIFIILLGGISMAYIILYTFVMRAAAKQIKAISLQRNNSSFDCIQTSGIFDPNMVIHEPTNDLSIRKENNSMHDIQNGVNGKHSVTRSSGQSHKRHTPMLQRHGFPTKTMIWFILTIVFIVTYLTHIILSLRVGRIVTMEPGEFASFSFFFRIYFVNHMINPLVYAIFVTRFRDSCRNIGPIIMEKLSQLLC
ncbi:D(1A) dopamine receptor-like [Dreissena polymorpha]|nr:D(1A) dopamine receptor-like [Dreissena polymorpha]